MLTQVCHLVYNTQEQAVRQRALGTGVMMGLAVCGGGRRRP